jgi:hypothetical protein
MRAARPGKSRGALQGLLSCLTGWLRPLYGRRKIWYRNGCRAGKEVFGMAAEKKSFTAQSCERPAWGEIKIRRCAMRKINEDNLRKESQMKLS